jgi:small subunit ribosomal protein S5
MTENDRKKRRGARREERDMNRREEEREKRLIEWLPLTELGKKVKNGEISSLDEVFEKNQKILEPEIIDSLVPDLMEEVVDFKKTTKVRRAGRQFAFRVSVLVGDGNNFIGLGTANDKDKWPAVRKATRKAKLNMIKIYKGCGSWECTCGETHSVPFKVSGKSSSVRISLLPAPKGTGLVIGDKIKSVLRFVGIKDVWSETKGNTASKLDFVAATINALKNTSKVKLSDEFSKKLGK